MAAGSAAGCTGEIDEGADALVDEVEAAADLGFLAALLVGEQELGAGGLRGLLHATCVFLPVRLLHVIDRVADLERILGLEGHVVLGHHRAGAEDKTGGSGDAD